MLASYKFEHNFAPSCDTFHILLDSTEIGLTAVKVIFIFCYTVKTPL